MKLKQETVEKVYDSEAALLLIDDLVWELVNKPNDDKVKQILHALKSYCDAAYDEVSGEKAEREKQADFEHIDYVASVHHAAAA